MYFVIPVVSRKSGSSSAVSSCIAAITQIAASTPMSTHSQVGTECRKFMNASILKIVKSKSVALFLFFSVYN